MKNFIFQEELEETVEDVIYTTEVMETEETLEDIERKQKPKHKLDDQHVKKHEKAVFELKLHNPKAKVKWIKDGKPISQSSKYDIEVYKKLLDILLHSLICNPLFKIYFSKEELHL